VFDTTGVGYCDAAEGFAPSVATLSAALADGKVSGVTVTSCKIVELPEVTAEYELVVKGLG
jgi:hypothetical protein